MMSTARPGLPPASIIACADPDLRRRATSALGTLGVSTSTVDGPGTPEGAPAAVVEVPRGLADTVPLGDWQERVGVLVLVPSDLDPGLWARCLACPGAWVLPPEAIDGACLRRCLASAPMPQGAAEDERKALRRRIRHDLSTPFRQITAIAELLRLAHSRGDREDFEACLSLLEQAAREGTELVERLGAEPAEASRRG